MRMIAGSLLILATIVALVLLCVGCFAMPRPMVNAGVGIAGSQGGAPDVAQPFRGAVGDRDAGPGGGTVCTELGSRIDEPATDGDDLGDAGGGVGPTGSGSSGGEGDPVGDDPDRGRRGGTPVDRSHRTADPPVAANREPGERRAECAADREDGGPRQAQIIAALGSSVLLVSALTLGQWEPNPVKLKRPNPIEEKPCS